MIQSPAARLLGLALLTFVALPLLLYGLAGVPARTLLKETLSILTLLSFSFVIGQFFLTRCFPEVIRNLKPQPTQWLHKTVAYSAVSILLVHPFLIVLPRFFEAGVRPLDALLTMVTTLESTGILLGLLAWSLMLLLGVTAWFRMRLIRRHNIRYRGWRYFHGTIAAVFLLTALWHAIDLGRHTGLALGSLFALLGGIGILRLARQYAMESPLIQGSRS